ncbi:HNH endonuclease [Proteocatella sphenisci]|uniref:HNH endonuclease n=1 Tax=Proteocatella sphenisci TaxID=181070 RepID=UPI00048D263B|nr:HNH endonuclease [Proteocatella sphenisci]
MSIKTKVCEISEYWFSRVDECGLSVDALEANERCWRCGYKNTLEKCHIIPDSLGGKDEPSNLVLLCHRCHLENPNVTDPEIMWDWIRAYGTSFYDTFWFLKGMQEYEFIYGKSFEEELSRLNIDDEIQFKDLFEDELKKTAFHFGHPYLNSATVAGVMRIVIKKYII